MIMTYEPVLRSRNVVIWSHGEEKIHRKRTSGEVNAYAADQTRVQLTSHALHKRKKNNRDREERRERERELPLAPLPTSCERGGISIRVLRRFRSAELRRATNGDGEKPFWISGDSGRSSSGFSLAKKGKKETLLVAEISVRKARAL
jgi:hypothetical protein